MKLTALLFLAALLAILVAVFTPHSVTRALRSAAALFVSGLRDEFATANVETAAGTNTVYTRRADASHSYTHLLVKAGSDAFHVAVCGAANYPIGSSSDSPDAAEDQLHVDPLNRTTNSRKLRSASALTNDVPVYTAANGFIQGEPNTAGTYWRIGRTAAASVQEGSSNYVTDVVTHAPVKVIVIAAATGTAATDVAALFTALTSGPAELKVVS